jgi:hypothetical protein
VTRALRGPGARALEQRSSSGVALRPRSRRSRRRGCARSAVSPSAPPPGRRETEADALHAAWIRRRR